MAIESIPAKRDVELILPPSETRLHRWLTLPNGLEVVVVSDGKCDKAGVAMDVGVGHAQDPVGLEGCAHFW
jgi:insulysin